MAKQIYYDGKAADETGADYIISIGERSNGKSFYRKNFSALRPAWNKDRKFIYLRRWDLEIKSSLVESYFNDAQIELISGGAANGVRVRAGTIYATYTDDEGNTKNIKALGYARSLAAEQHYTSGNYDDVDTIIFEEFVSRDNYLPNEVMRLMHFVSTVARRRKIKVYLIGNTISRVCPYFSEWGLRGVERQKAGTIDIYNYHTEQVDEDGQPVTVKIAVEYCANSGNNSKMFFGTKTNMITSGVWETKEYPHLPDTEKHFETLYTCYMQFNDFKFTLRFMRHFTSREVLWYITPKTTQISDTARIITNHFSTNPKQTSDFVPLIPAEKRIFGLLTTSACFSDNLTAQDFYTCLNAMRQAVRDKKV